MVWLCLHGNIRFNIWDHWLVTKLEFTGNLFSSFIETWSRVMDVKDHTEQIKYSPQNNKLMVLIPSPAYEHTNICFYHQDSIFLPWVTGCS